MLGFLMSATFLGAVLIRALALIIGNTESLCDLLVDTRH